MPAAALTVALAIALTLAAYAGEALVVPAVLVVQGLLVWGWHDALDVPGRTGGMVLAGAAAATADVLLLVRDDTRALTPVAGVLAVAMLGAKVHQLARRPHRERLTESLTATTTLVAIATLGALFVAAEQTLGGPALVTLAALSAAVAAAASLAPLPTALVAGSATVGGLFLGLLVAAMTHLPVGPALPVGAAAAATAIAAITFVRRARRRDLATAGSLPLLSVAPVAYVLGRILVG
ncbi:MAG: hypothetical protein ABJA93_07710 [Sporichthyaceae bacterium]